MGEKMRVTLKFYALLRELVGRKELIVDLDNDDAKIIDVLDAIKKEISEEVYHKIINFYNREKGPRLVILLNGRNIVHLEGLETKVRDGDRLDIFPPAGGG